MSDMRGKTIPGSAEFERRTKQALKVLTGLPIWGARRALDVFIFDVGAHRPTLNSKGEQVEVGEYALHISCPWRIVGPEGMAVGSEDRWYPADEDSDWSEFNPDGPTLFGFRMSTWLDAHRTSPLVIGSVTTDRVGGFKLNLGQEWALEVFPADSLQRELCERWRLFRPGESSPSFVVTNLGIEE
jgi:hypothetical protein